jgi:hypothetical protein
MLGKGENRTSALKFPLQNFFSEGTIVLRAEDT